jgi:hypothetical protein
MGSKSRCAVPSRQIVLRSTRMRPSARRRMRSWASGGRRIATELFEAGAIVARDPDVGVEVEALELDLARAAGGSGSSADLTSRGPFVGRSAGRLQSGRRGRAARRAARGREREPRPPTLAQKGASHRLRLFPRGAARSSADPGAPGNSFEAAADGVKRVPIVCSCYVTKASAGPLLSGCTPAPSRQRPSPFSDAVRRSPAESPCIDSWTTTPTACLCVVR